MKSITNLLFPMAGAGSRFKANGNQIPKPLLELHGRYFFEIAAKNLMDETENFTLSFVVLKEDCDRFNINLIIREVFPFARVEILNSPTSGAAETAYLGLRNLNIGEGALVIADCDQWLWGKAVSRIFMGLEQEQFDVAVPHFNSDNPSYSYLTNNEKGKIKKISEKVAISKKAVAGCYGFRSIELFLELYNQQPEWGTEKYMSNVVARAMMTHLDVRSFELDWHVPFGTPAEYRSALEHEGLRGLIDGW